jgi:hypothetical protein
VPRAGKGQEIKRRVEMRKSFSKAKEAVTEEAEEEFSKKNDK